MSKVMDWMDQEDKLQEKINVLQDIIADLEYQRDKIIMERLIYQVENPTKKMRVEVKEYKIIEDKE